MMRSTLCADEPISEFSLKDPKVEYFVQDEDDLDLDRLIGQDGVLHEFGWRTLR